MRVYQQVKLVELQSQLRKLQGDTQFWPLLESSERSLHHQPPASALPSQLGSRKQIILEGPPGSGKTVLALYLGTSEGSLEFVYLEAQRWAPSHTRPVLDDFLLMAGSDHSRAVEALQRNKLVLILDAADEASWRTGGASALDVLPKLSEELAGRAGLLITVRTSKTLPTLAVSPILATLGGIAEEDVPRFLAAYAGGRSGVGQAVERLKSSNLPSAIKYSPLILRRFAEGLVLKKIPDNLAELFEHMGDFHIERECQKPRIVGTALIPGSWQEGYSDPLRHRQLVSALVYNSGTLGGTITEPEFQKFVERLLRPTSVSARGLVDISTLMAQHPLVAVSYISDPAGIDHYHVHVAHDWVRTALFSKFMSDACFDAQVETCDSWHEALPHADDFALAWEYLGGRTIKVLDQILHLTSTPKQMQIVSGWLLSQLFHPETFPGAKSAILSSLAKLAYRFVPQTANVINAVAFSPQHPAAPIIKGIEFHLDSVQQNGNLFGVTFDGAIFVVERSGPNYLSLKNCVLRNSEGRIYNDDCRLYFEGCFIESLRLEASRGQVKLAKCVYDPAHCIFPEGTIGLETCERADIAAEMYKLMALAEVLRRFVVVVDPDRPALAKRKTNISEDNLYHGIVGQIGDLARRIVEVLVNNECLDRKPTGGVRRLDPTGKFDAQQAASFINAPLSTGQGSMIVDVLSKL